MAFKGDDSTLSLATTVTLALAVAAMVFVKTPLQSSRPPGIGMGLHEAEGELKVRARLWEDPFAAVEKAVESSKQLSVQVAVDGKNVAVTTSAVGSQPPDIDGLESLRKRIQDIETDKESILALVVMTQGGSSLEASEVRIRDRYAIHAGLEVGCFVPKIGESLSYFTWKFSKKAGHIIPPLQYTPYEWYSRNPSACSEDGDSIRHVLVLWTKSPESDDKILARLDALLEKVHPPDWKQRGKRLRVKLLGPRSSSEFRSVLDEIHAGLSRKPPAPFKWPTADGVVELYSPWATVPPALLAYGMKSEKTPDELLTAAGLVSTYRVTNDNVLFAALLDELDRRKVKIGEDRIVLIGEWDSFYARALPPAFTAAACRHMGNRPCNDIQSGFDTRSKPTTPEELNIRQYSYLSGLDGETAEDQDKRTKSKEDDKPKDWDKTDGKNRFRDIDSYERPEGKAQLDYVRRLATRIKAECQDLSRKDDNNGEQEENEKKRRNGKVKAIGILGRDPYDALLILQALREEFPNALFFATDLDARYFHQDELKWTRNLIVASQFGLQLQPSLQQSIPPFRSSLQTSTFFALLQAIGRVTLEGSKFILSGSKLEYAAEIPPRLFEIGRHGAVDLSPVGRVKDLPTIHPVRTDVDPTTGTFNPPARIRLLWIVGLTLGFLLIWGYGRLWNWMAARDEPDPSKRRLEWMPRSVWVALPVVMALVVTCRIVHLERYTEEEPFSWTDGVSIWPTEALRFVAFCLSLLFLFKARADSARNFDELTKSFSLDLQPDPKVVRWRDKLKGFWSDLNWMFHGSKQDHPGDVKDLWMRYRRAHGLLPRAARIAMGFAAYLLVMLPLVLIMNGGELRHAVPCRGTFSCGLDSMALTVSVVSFLILNLALLDAVILCTKWIQEMPAAMSKLASMQKIRLIVERSTVVNRRVLHPFLVLFLLVAARNHYFDNWDFPSGLILALTVNSLVVITSATVLYVAAVGAKRRILATLQHQLDKTAPSADQTDSADQRASDESIRLLIKEVDGIQQGAFVPFYQQPMVQATLVAALAFLQYWYLGQ